MSDNRSGLDGHHAGREYPPADGDIVERQGRAGGYGRRSATATGATGAASGATDPPAWSVWTER